jgi:hypothetical protein
MAQHSIIPIFHYSILCHEKMPARITGSQLDLQIFGRTHMRHVKRV